MIYKSVSSSLLFCFSQASGQILDSGKVGIAKKKKNCEMNKLMTIVEPLTQLRCSIKRKSTNPQFDSLFQISTNVRRTKAFVKMANVLT